MSAQEHEDVVEITEAQWAAGRRRALEDLGCSYEELSEMARSRQYESVRHRLAWIAYGE